MLRDWTIGAAAVMVATVAALLGMHDAAGAPADPDTKPLFMTMRLPITSGSGRLDQLAYDPGGQHLFVSSPSTGTVHVLSLSMRSVTGGGAAVGPINDLPEPQGLAWVPSLDRLFIACGGDGSVRAYTNDKNVMRALGSVQFPGEAEDLAMDPDGKRLWVSHGRALSWLNVEAGVKGDTTIRLSGHAEAIVLDSKPAAEGGRLYATIARPGKVEGSATAPKPHVAVIDRGKGEVTAMWELGDEQGNYALALDEKGERLFVICRSPAKALVLDTKTGKQVAALDCGGDSDGAAWDEATQRLFITAGADGGKIHVYKRKAADEYTLENTIGTLAGAATCELIPDKRLLLVVVPQVGPEPGAMFHYEIRD